MDPKANPNQNLFGPAKPKTKRKVSQNFIESIRDMGGSIGSQVKNLGGGMASGAIDSLFGKTSGQNQGFDGLSRQNGLANPNQPFNFEEYLHSREKQIRAQERTLAQRLRDNEKILYNRKDAETKQQIICVQEEIKKIVKETNGLAVELIEAEKTVSTTIVASGTYHINFFERIRRLIMLARKRVSEAKDWLALFNSRQGQRQYYWGQVKKSGTKFMLSADRYTSTQAG